jgi:hypothetical protein
LHSNQFAGNAGTIDEILFDLNNLSSPDYNQSFFSTGFGLEYFHSGPATLDAEMYEDASCSPPRLEQSFASPFSLV